jgi:hypothetical protein
MTQYTGQRTIMLEYKFNDILKEDSLKGQLTIDKIPSYKTQDSYQTDGIIQQLKIPDR